MAPGEFAGWVPIRVFWRGGEGRVDWCYFGHRRFSEPFFRDSVMLAVREPFNQAFRRETAFDALLDWQQASPGLAPTAFLHHASRCGSTLVSQMLAALPGHVVISEPPMLDALLRARYQVAVPDRAAHVAWIRALVSALAQARNGETAFVVKLDAWSIFELALLREAFPDTPWVYLYRDPLEIGVSQLRERGAYMVPGMLGPALELMDLPTALAMPPEEFIARILGRMLEAGRAGCDGSGGVPLHYSELPQAMWTSCREIFAVPAGEVAPVALQAAARWNAKNPQMAFEADAQRKQREASPELRRAIERFAGQAYRDIERTRTGASARAEAH